MLDAEAAVGLDGSNYYAATHWSQANYVALMSGQFNHCQQQDGGIACHQDVDNLYHQARPGRHQLEDLAGGRGSGAAATS